MARRRSLPGRLDTPDKGLITIVFTSVLLDKRLISQETFTALLMMAVVSTILTVPVVSRKFKGIPKWR